MSTSERNRDAAPVTRARQSRTGTPRYNPETNNLEWAIDALGDEPDGSSHPILNHNIRLLGRHGVMKVSLVVDPEDYATVLPEVSGLLDGFSFQAGSKHSEYRSGDKVAKYGLAALVAGGAAAVALKTGLFKKFGKLLIVVVVAIAAFFKKIWRAITGRSAAQHERNE